MQQNPYQSPQAGLQQGRGHAVALVTPRVLLATARCRPWLFVLSVACFVALAVGAIGMLTAQGEYNTKGVWEEAPVETASLVMGGIVGLIQLLCGTFFWMFGLALGKLGSSRNENDLVNALRAELNLLRVVGITALVYVGLIVVVIMGAIALSGAAAGDEEEPPATAEGE